MARVFITGGAGFIGSHCVDVLLASGHQVVVFDKKSVAEAVNLQHCLTQITYHQADVADRDALYRAMAGCDVVLHLAAFVSVPRSIIEPVQAHADNVTGTLHVFEAMRQLGIVRGAYASSAAVYGDPHVVPTPETTILAPLSPYGLHKVQNEQCAALYARQYELQLTGLRFFNVYGRRQDPSSPYSGVISIFMDRIGAGQTVTVHGDGLATRDFVHVSDVAAVCAQALLCEADVPSVCNVGTGKAVSVRDLVRAIESVVATPAVVQHGQARPGDIAHSCADTARLQATALPLPQTSLSTGLQTMVQ